MVDNLLILVFHFPTDAVSFETLIPYFSAKSFVQPNQVGFLNVLLSVSLSRSRILVSTPSMPGCQQHLERFFPLTPYFIQVTMSI